MVVRNLKCPQCGSIKMNELSTGYIYCDFCSALMGYDMKNIHDESKAVFSPENLSKPKQKEYFSLIQKMAAAIRNEDSRDYVDCQVKMKAIEFDLFPKRFSPKAKQNAYRQKQLDFFEAYWIELLENDYFSKSKQFQDIIATLQSNLTSHVENGEVFYEFNDAFIDFLKATDEFTKTSVKESLQMKCMELYPELHTPNFEILYKQSIDAALQMFDSETVKKAIQYLHLETEYITIDDIAMSLTECIVCNSELKVPNGSKAMVCETCGNVNDFIEKKIQCISCGAPVPFSETNTCEFCGAVHLSFKENKYTRSTKEVESSAEKKRGFFGRLFKS